MHKPANDTVCHFCVKHSGCELSCAAITSYTTHRDNLATKRKYMYGAMMLFYRAYLSGVHIPACRFQQYLHGLCAVQATHVLCWGAQVGQYSQRIHVDNKIICDYCLCKILVGSLYNS